jgi:type I restriction enzyme M protein|tara:strand:+ start:408 stop:2420 length:2013 start_codon:yes stop_codon:yes gene_type:complete
MDDISHIEKRLWSVADNLRANSNFASNEYFLPVMGLIFLRHAYSRFQKVRAEIEETLPSRGGVTRALTKEDFSQRSAIFLTEKAKFPYLVAVPDGDDRVQSIVEAMEAIESDYPALNGVLPKQEYIELGNDDLGGLLRTFNDPRLEKADGDVFGRIYEYFLTQFAGNKAHDGGEFFTPPSLVQTIVNVIEPDHGNIIDPACGSGGMFVQSAHFIERMKANANERVTFYGMEKNPTTIRLAKMNLAVHGLEGNIAQAISYYEDPHAFRGKADFVMANPPFNVDEIDAEKIKTDPRLGFGLPGVNKEKKVSNGNYVWMSFFHAYLSDTGRAGIVMSSQSSSAGGEEAKVRQAMIKTGDVDVMIAIRSNFFYTRSVPCELWFFDKGKPEAMREKVLMIDARQIFNKVTRKIFDFTPQQQKNISSIVWLYRGQTDRFIDLVAEHLTRAIEAVSGISLSDFIESAEEVLEVVSGIASPEDQDSPEVIKKALNTISETVQKITEGSQKLSILAELSDLKLAESAIAEFAEMAKDVIKQIDLFYKQANAVFNNENSGQNGKGKKVIKIMDETREELKDILKSFRTMHSHAHWLLTRFPDAKLVNVEGLVKLVDQDEIKANDWSLTPGRYVGVAKELEDEDFNFEEAMTSIHDELELLNAESEDLAIKISSNIKSLIQ